MQVYVFSLGKGWEIGLELERPRLERPTSVSPSVQSLVCLVCEVNQTLASGEEAGSLSPSTWKKTGLAGLGSGDQSPGPNMQTGRAWAESHVSH